MNQEITPKEQRSIAKEEIPIIINRAMAALERAKTYAEKMDAIDEADSIFERLAKSIKSHKDLEFELETAKAELIIAIDRVKIEIAIEYDKAKKEGLVAPQGRPKELSEKEKTSEPRTFSDSDKPKLNELNIEKQRISEARKIHNFDEKNPGLREQIIKEMPGKNEKVTKNISFRIAKEAEKERKRQTEILKQEQILKNAQKRQEEFLRKAEQLKREKERLEAHLKGTRFHSRSHYNPFDIPSIRRHPFTMDEWRLVVSCLHPDTRLNMSNEKLDKALQILLQRKAELTGQN